MKRIRFKRGFKAKVKRLDKSFKRGKEKLRKAWSLREGIIDNMFMISSYPIMGRLLENVNYTSEPLKSAGIIGITTYAAHFINKSSDMLVEALEKILTHTRISIAIVGTIIASGSSSPEFVGSTVAALRGGEEFGMALSNYVGSNMFNPMIIAITSLIPGFKLSFKGYISHLSVMSGSMLFLSNLASDGKLDRFDSISIMALVGLYLWGKQRGVHIMSKRVITLWERIKFRNKSDEAKKRSEVKHKQKHKPKKEEPREENINIKKEAVVAALSLVSLVLMASLAISGITGIMGLLGISATFAGLLIMAFMTSLPELAISVKSALRKSKNSAKLILETVVTSNLVNCFFSGATSLISSLVQSKPLTYSMQRAEDLKTMFNISLILLAMGIVSRAEDYLREKLKMYNAANIVGHVPRIIAISMIIYYIARLVSLGI